MSRVVVRNHSTGGEGVVTDTPAGAGDALAYAYRAFYRFDLSGLVGANVTTATLRTYQYQVNGTPYTQLGNLLAEHVLLGDSLAPGDFDGPACAPALGTLSLSAAIGARTLDATQAVRDDLTAGRPHCWIRLRFPTLGDGNTDEDLVYLVSAASSGGTGERPTLNVTFTR